MFIKSLNAFCKCCILSCVILLSVALPTPAQSPATQAGTIPGDFSVSANGDAQYKIPIEVPPGIHHAEPGLAFIYSSNRGNGRMGVGWDIEGLSAIYRCKAVPAFDDYFGSINYDYKDRYCFDGQRLINTQGSNGYANSVYHTSLETWRTVTASADLCGQGPCSFTVTNSNGAVFKYGVTTDSRIKAVGRPDVRLWALSSVQDLNGNTISFTYSSDPLSGGGLGQYYVTRIDYTANNSAGVEANRSVQFVYQKRPDIETHYQGGAPITTSYRLSNVQTYLGTQVVRDYRVAYQVSGASGRSEVLNVKACPTTASSAVCVTATNFQWQGSDQIRYSKAALQTSMPVTFSQLVPADFNGDGLGDLLSVSQGSSSSKQTAQVYLSTGTDFRRCTSMTSLTLQGTIVAGDVNGDGRLDLIQLAMQGSKHVVAWYLGQSDGCTFQYQGVFDTGLSAIGQNVWPMDFNGDGRTDLVEASLNNHTETLTAFVSLGNGFSRASTKTIDLGSSTSSFQPMDVNGDGMADIVQLWNNSSNQSYRLTSYISSGTDFNTAVVTALQPVDSPSFFPADINGDGNVDLLRISAQAGTTQLTTYLSDGIGGFIQGTNLNTGQVSSGTLAVWPMDTTGDGQTDLVQAWKDNTGVLHLILYQNTDTGFAKGTDLGVQLSSSDFQTTYPMDLAGQGRMSVVQGWPNGNDLHFSNYGSTQESLDRIDNIVNGMGNQTEISYLPMSDGRVYTRPGDRAAYPRSSVPGYSYRQSPAQYPFQAVGGGTLQLVWQYRDVSASGALSPYNYLYTQTYSSAMMDFTGHGWLGFATVSRLNNQNGQLHVDTYNQAYPLSGTITTSQLFCVVAQVSSPDPLCPASGPTLLSSGLTAWQQVVTAQAATAPYASVYLIEKGNYRTDSYTYGVYNNSRGKTYQYDSYGQVTLLSNLGYESQQGKDLSPDDNVYTCTQYYSSSGTPLLGFPTAIKVASDSSCANLTVFNSTTDFSLEKVAYTQAMDVYSDSAWDSSNNVYLTTSFTYDAFGNVTISNQPGNRITQYVFDQKYHTYPVTMISPPDEAGTKLVSQYAWDPRFGATAGYADPNGFVTANCIDSLGQLIATQAPVPNFGNVTPDPGCIGTITSANDTVFTQAQLVTVDSRSMLADASGTVYQQDIALQDWGPGATRNTRFNLSYYDGRGRTFQTVAQGLSSTGNTAICNIYDSTDQTTQQTLPYYISGQKDSCSLSKSDPRYWVTTVYDVYGRPTKSTVPAGPDGHETSVTTSSYPTIDASVVTTAAGDPYAIQKTLQFQYFDSTRRVTKMSVPDSSGAVTTYSYDRIARLTSVVDPPTASNPNGVANNIAYDSLNRRSSLNNPDQNTTGSGNAAVWKYSPSTGFLQSLTDAKGQVSNYTEDQLGRVLTQTLSDGSSFQFTYDNPDIATRSLGKMASAALCAAEGTTRFLYAYTYDTDGEPYITVLNMPGYQAYSETTLHDPLARMYQMQYPDASVAQKIYQMGNLQQTTLDGKPYVTWSQYNPMGEAQSVAYGNGVTTANTYAPAGQLNTSVTLDAKQQPLLNQTLSWNHLFEVTAIADNLKGPTDYSQGFTYQLGRLTAASATGLYGNISYGYDASGNLTQQNSTAYTYSAHRIMSGTASGATVLNAGYDANGNLQTKTDSAGKWQFSYDPLNRLHSVTLDGNLLLSIPTVDHNQRRLLRTNAQQYTSVYATPEYLVTDYGGLSSVGTRYLMSSAGPLVAVTNTLSGTPPSNPGAGYPVPGTLYYIADYLGTTQLTTGADGTLVSRFGYAPYGAAIPEGTSGPDDITQKFQGNELDESSNLYYITVRYYDPSLGRFSTPDTTMGGDPLTIDAFNRFAFSLNNPVSQRDVAGHGVADSIIGDIVSSAEIVAGIGIDIASGGALEPVGGALINGGINGLMYSAQDSKNFSWKQFGKQEGIGAAMGLFVPGFGSGELVGAEGSAALSRGFEEVADKAAIDALAVRAVDRAGVEQFDREAVSFETGELSQSAGATATKSAEGGIKDEGEEISESCELAGSFSSGTVVASADGPRRIEELHAGDRVLGLDPNTRNAGYFEVTKTFEVESTSLIVIDVDGKRVESAPGQRYWVVGHGWKAASELAPGDLLRDEHEHDHKVTSVEQHEGHFDLHGAEIDRAHTLFASNEGLLAHNGKSCRLTALGRTPGKNSRAGREVLERWIEAGDAEIRGGRWWVRVQIDAAGRMEWRVLDENIHMGHIDDAVHWWNREGHLYGVPGGRPSPQAREFMLNSDNYNFEWGPLNSSNGARLGVTYDRPAGWMGEWPPR